MASPTDGAVVSQAALVTHLVGHPDAVRDSLLTKAPAHLKQHLRDYVMPVPPGRLQFKCMRGGGPVSETNHNPDQSCHPGEDLMNPAWPYVWPAGLPASS